MSPGGQFLMSFDTWCWCLAFPSLAEQGTPTSPITVVPDQANRLAMPAPSVCSALLTLQSSRLPLAEVRQAGVGGGSCQTLPKRAAGRFENRLCFTRRFSARCGTYVYVVTFEYVDAV